MAQNMERVNEVMNFMQITQSLGPQGQLYLNQEKAIDFIADNLGIPASLRTTPQERQALVEQATQIEKSAPKRGLILFQQALQLYIPAYVFRPPLLTKKADSIVSSQTETRQSWYSRE